MEEKDFGGAEVLLPRIVFGFDEKWEALNWYTTFAKESAYGLQGGNNKWNPGDIPSEVGEIVARSKSEQEALAAIKPVLERFLREPHATETMEQTITRAERRWGKVGQEYFPRLSKMLDIPLGEFEREYYALFTFGRRCPFHHNKFAFSRFNDFSNAASHEIMHIEFLKKYGGYCRERGLSETQISHLKEILTVLLNEDMADLLYHPDYSYTKHQEIRPKVLALYQENKTADGRFTDFLDKAIALVKEAKFGS